MANAEDRLIAYRRTITIIAVVVVLYLSFLIIKPFLIAIIGAAVLAYLFYPLYKWLAKIIPGFLPKEGLAALLTVLLIIVIVLVPMVLITGILANEARGGYVYLQQIVSQPGFTLNFKLPTVLGREIGDLSQFKPQILNFSSQFVVWLQQILKKIPGAFLGIFMTVFSIYFFLKGGKDINRFLQDFFPLPEGCYKQIFSRFGDLTKGIVLGQLVVGVIHGFLSWLAYAYLGVPNPVLWAFLTAIISIIPVLGAGLVWFPVAVYLFVVGSAVGTEWQGLALFAYGILVLTSVDNILKPKIMGDHARIHPLIILFGILGGIQLLGLPGILIGPLVLALFDVVMNIFREVI
ncbi:hypothetical protein A2291_07530 [candidate division WOR-1 bacterium RIFOXYB2_FULL_42_35]|uniref:AI-2E family transporter n=1 Tax=candidate division WOR-1 bacterium RIFOXYC2_FULL_41_25 TaxID=1802586 RepID=A0A1F4TJ17_UNCSA|nr:MAG: hypothetical protein A2247_08055 [candidate division WOR-1 bacterium RIFOXYA2_FULL_41_14]OGC21777.1 MAG: hypothetical protein A2291_07530 [candidate division WOR-1 bacterium RIFOXYB2_FULL_42_35]OGC32674.1 MAG: hypothetical protein A2462_03915 [candidate division WOR-1 bacterium RIFOXYC2_FULL_41_25]